MNAESAFDQLIDSAPPAPTALLDAVQREVAGYRSVSRRRRRRRLAWGGAGLAYAAFAFTAPGQAATRWIGDLAGIGESPTLPQVDSVDGTQVVLESGSLDDGTPYELVAKRVDAFGPNGAVCFQIDFPSLQDAGAGGACTTSNSTGKAADPAIEDSGVIPVPGSGEGAPALYLGIADDPRIESVDLKIESTDGVSSLNTDLVTVDGEVLRRIGGTHPVTAFIVPLRAGEATAAQERPSPVTAVAYNAEGNIVDRRGPSVFRLDPQRSAGQGARNEQQVLVPGPLPDDLPNPPDLSLSNAGLADFRTVTSRDWTGASAFGAMGAMAENHRGSNTGPLDVYLARVDGGDLVYVVTTQPDASTRGDPLLSIGIFDAQDLSPFLPNPKGP